MNKSEITVKSKANVMVLRTEEQVEGRFDRLKWMAVVVLILAGTIANHYYSELSVWIRTPAWLVLLAMAGFIAATTQKGKWLIEFFRDSQAELRKVVWPTRAETRQTTLVVAAMVTVLALLLWGMDGVLVWLIGWMTGQH